MTRVQPLLSYKTMNSSSEPISASKLPCTSRFECVLDDVTGHDERITHNKRRLIPTHLYSTLCVREAESHEDSMGDECAAHALPGRERTGDTGAMKRRGVVEVTSSGMTHSCMTTHGRTMCEAYLQSWRQHRWRDDAYYM